MKKAILIVSFGTSYTETRIKNITAIKNQVSMLYPDTIIEEAVSVSYTHLTLPTT